MDFTCYKVAYDHSWRSGGSNTKQRLRDSRLPRTVRTPCREHRWVKWRAPRHSGTSSRLQLSWFHSFNP